MSEGTHQVSQVLEEKEVCGSFDASSVNVLDASWNALMDIAGAERFKNLSTLSISHNKLKTFSLSCPWHNLLELDISSNELESLKDLEKLPKLRRLKASHNFLTNLLDVAHCKNLEGLDVRQNSISNLDGVGNLCKLQVLQLDCNPVKSLLVLRPLSILPQLQTLSLEGSLLTAKIQPMQLKVLLRNLLPGLKILNGLPMTMNNSYSKAREQVGRVLSQHKEESKAEETRPSQPQVSLTTRWPVKEEAGKILSTGSASTSNQAGSRSRQPALKASRLVGMRSNQARQLSTGRKHILRRPAAPLEKVPSSPSRDCRNTEAESGSFRKLCKIESGSSVAQGNLLLSARARASIAIDPNELEDEGANTPIRGFRLLKKIESGSSVDKFERLARASQLSSHNTPSHPSSSRRQSHTSRSRVSFAGDEDSEVDRKEEGFRVRSVSFRRRTEDIPHLRSDSSDHCASGKNRSDWQASVSFGPTAEVIEYGTLMHTSRSSKPTSTDGTRKGWSRSQYAGLLGLEGSASQEAEQNPPFSSRRASGNGHEVSYGADWIPRSVFQSLQPVVFGQRSSSISSDQSIELNALDSPVMLSSIETLGALEEKFPVTRAIKQPSNPSEREASHNNLLSLLERSAEEAEAWQGQPGVNSLAAKVARALKGLPVTKPSASHSDPQKPHLHVRVKPMDVSCKDKVQAPTAIAKAQAGSSPKHLHVSSEAEDTALLYEKFRLREIEATAQEGAPKGSLQKRLQALFTADERPPIQLRPHKPKRRPVTNTPEPSQAEHIQSSESAERSQELNRLFDGCLSLHPSSTIPPHLDPAATRNESSAGSGRALSESGKSSGNVAALVAAFSGSSPNFKQKEPESDRKSTEASSFGIAEEPQEVETKEEKPSVSHWTMPSQDRISHSTIQSNRNAAWKDSPNLRSLPLSKRSQDTAGISSSGRDFGSRSFSDKMAETKTRTGDAAAAVDEDLQGDALEAEATIIQYELDPEESSLEANIMPPMPSTNLHEEAEDLEADKYTDQADESGEAAVELSATAVKLTQKKGIPDTSISRVMHAVRADYLCQPSCEENMPGTASEAHNVKGVEQSKEAGFPYTLEPFKSQEWQPEESFVGQSSTGEASTCLKDGGAEATCEAAHEFDERNEEAIEDAASVDTDAGEADSWALHDIPQNFVSGAQAVRKGLREEQDRGSIGMTALYEARANHSQEATAGADSETGGKWKMEESSFTSHMDKPVFDNPETEEEMSQGDFKKLADTSLGSQDFSRSQQLGTLHGNESLTRDTLKMSGTARKRGRARQPRFAFPRQPESPPSSISQFMESEDPQTLQASSQEEIVLPFVGPFKTLPASPEHSALVQTSSLHVHIPRKTQSELQISPPYLNVKPALLQTATERSWDTESAEEYSHHGEDAEFGGHAPLNSSTRRDVLWVPGDSPVLRANDQGAVVLKPALKQSSRSLMATPLKDLLPSPTAESGPLISQRSSFRLASLLPWSHDHSHRAHLKAKKLAHSRSEAASDVDIAAAALSPGSSGDLNFSSNDAGGAQVIRKNMTKGGNKGFLNKALKSLGHGKTLFAEASELSQQSLASQVTDDAAESPRQKATLMKRVVRSLSFKALPKGRHAKIPDLGERQGSGMAYNMGDQKVSVHPGETLNTGIASQLAAFGLSGEPSSSSGFKEETPSNSPANPHLGQKRRDSPLSEGSGNSSTWSLIEADSQSIKPETI